MAALARKALILALWLGLAAAHADSTPPELGLWQTADNSGVIEISACNGALCGRLVGFRDQPPPHDYRGQSECGLAFIQPMRLDQDGKYHGRILDPETGDIYRATMGLAADGTLHLRGYLGISLFGQTQIWHRYSGPLLPGCRLA